MMLLLSILIFASCEDESKNPLPDFGSSQGAFVRFVLNEVPGATVSFVDPSVAIYGGTIEDVNENISSYSLEMVATVSGEQIFVNNFLEITEFPAELAISAEDIAASLGITIDDLGFGDNFAFIATATRDDGVISRGEEPIFDPDTGVLSGGDTSNNLLGLPGYRSAMAFNFTYACPEFDISELAGTYNVDFNNLEGALGLVDPNPTREIILGPRPNQVTVVGGSVGFVGGDDLIVNVDVTTGVLSLGLDADGNAGLAFPVGTAGLTFDSDYGEFAPGGLVLTCLDDLTLDLRVTLTCCGGTFGMGLTKQ